MNKEINGEDMWILSEGRVITRYRKWTAFAIYVAVALAALASSPGTGLVTTPYRSAGLLFGLLLVYWIALRLLSHERN